MGRCNNRRVQQAAAERNSVPSRARFSKGPPKKNRGRGGGRGGRGGGRGGRGGGSAAADAAKKSVISKITKRVEAKSRDAGGISGVISSAGGKSSSSGGGGTTRIISKRPKRHPLEGVDVTKFDEIKLSEESLLLVTNLLTTLGVVEDRNASNESASTSRRNSSEQQLSGPSSTLRPSAGSFVPEGKMGSSSATLVNPDDFVPTFNHMDIGDDDDDTGINTDENGIHEDAAAAAAGDLANVYSLSSGAGVETGGRQGYEEYENDGESNECIVDDSAIWAEEQLRMQDAQFDHDDDMDDAVRHPASFSSERDLSVMKEEEGVDDESSSNDDVEEDDGARESALFLHLTTELSFEESDALQAVRVLEGWKVAGIGADATDEKKKDEDAETASKKRDSNELDSDELGLALDWLCLHLSDEDLKSGFRPNPKAKDKFGKRLKKNGALLPGTGATRPIAHESISIAPPFRGSEFKETADRASRKIGFVRLGFHRSEAEKACEMTGPTPPSITAEEDTHALRILLTFLEAEVLGEDGISSPLSGGAKPNSADLEFAATEREQEIEALEAIYAETFEIVGTKNGEENRLDPECRLRLKLGPIEGEKTSSKIEGSKLHVFCRATYPLLSPPLLLFTNPTLAPSLLRRINEEMIKRVKETVGEPVVFAMMEYLNEHVPCFYDDFAREQRAKEMAAEQLRLRKEAGHDIEKVIEAQYESGGQIGRRQRAKLRAAEKAYDRNDQLAKAAMEREKKRVERMERIRSEDKNQRYTRAEQYILQREKDRIADEAEKASRAAMNAAFLRGESTEDAREAALRARIESLRANGQDVPANHESIPSEDEKKEDDGAHAVVDSDQDNVEDDDDDTKMPAASPEEKAFELPGDEVDDADGNGGGGATMTTLAFTDRLKEFYAKEKAKKEALLSGKSIDDNDGLSNYHLMKPGVEEGDVHAGRSEAENNGGDEDMARSDAIAPIHVPTPVFIPSSAVKDVVQSVVEEQKQQPWLVCPEARAPTLEDDSTAMHNKSDLSPEDLREREDISRSLRQDLQRKYRSAEHWEKKGSGNGKGKRSGGGSLGQRFHLMMSQRSRLPAFKMKDDIVRTIANNQITVISGDTGCGKTTQVPQLVLDDMIMNNRGAEANIIITQPRRISAIGVAERIAAERCERIGETSGYSIRLENKRSAKTRLLMCTTGILLRRLQVDPDLASVSHVFVDEVHERDLNTDFMLMILKDLLLRRKNLKLVLMSATLNADTFSRYFEGCPTASIPGRAHPVKEFRLEDVLQATGYEVQEGSDYAIQKKKNATPVRSKSALKKLLPGYKSNVINSLAIVDEEVINYELIAELLEYITLNHEEGAILVFLPGMQEITKLIDEVYKKEFFTDPSKTVVYPLHSSLSTAEQTAVFDVPPKGVRKIVCATNIAETSITIEDVVYVVDAGRVKENRQDEVNQMPTLVECWVSKASAKQRRGRAGRVRPGVAYHLYSTPTYQHEMAEYQLPEMLRVGLEDLVLQVMLLDLGEPSVFLAKAVDPPSGLAIRNSLKLLEGLGAVDCEWDDEAIRFSRPNATPSTAAAAKDDSCDVLAVSSGLTALGFHLATLPVDPRVGKMMIYGALFGCIDPALTIAAAMSARNPFMSPFDKREEADARRKEFSTEGSDHLTTLRAFNDWRQLRKEKGDRSAQTFLRDNFLSRLTLFQIEDLRRQFTDLLIDIGFLPKKFRCDRIRGGSRGGGRGGNFGGKDIEDDSGPNKNSKNMQLLKAILCAGLYPNIIVAPRPLVRGTSDKKVGECAFSSQKGDVYLHPCTVSFQESKLDSRYACYHEIVKTSKIYVRDFTTVSEFALLLFGGSLKVHHQYGVVAVDEWLKFRIAAKPATLVKYLRTQTEIMLLRKIVRPEDDITESPEGKALIEAVSTLLATEIGGAIEGPDRSAADIVRPWTGNPDGGRNYSGGRAGGRGGRGGRGTRGRGGKGRGGGGGRGR